MKSTELALPRWGQCDCYVGIERHLNEESSLIIAQARANMRETRWLDDNDKDDEMRRKSLFATISVTGR